MSNVNRQIQVLMREEGLTLEQACKSLGLDVEAGALAVASMQTRQEITLGQLVERFKPEAVNILMEIAQTGERDADRVKACQILLEGRGVMPEVNAMAATEFKRRFLQMRENLGLVIDVTEDSSMMAMAK